MGRTGDEGNTNFRPVVLETMELWPEVGVQGLGGWGLVSINLSLFIDVIACATWEFLVNVS